MYFEDCVVLGGGGLASEWQFIIVGFVSERKHKKLFNFDLDRQH